ncbi:MAG: carboxymuconolactone decarboxylase family protein [Chloroflexi bacterium]|nr:carboxymuconolactone decarboxylase family protein [Chloroflexota bacterium]
MPPTKREAQEFLDRMYQERGYIVDFHKLVVQADLEWLKAYDAFVRATYTGQRRLDRRTKELIQTAVLSALRTDVDHIGEHIRLAMEHGASKEEVLEALECVYAPMGALGFRQGLKAWAKVNGIKEMEPTALARPARGKRQKA